MVLEHYKTELELAQYVSKLEAQVKGYKALCERLQAQADEMRSACQWISVDDRLPEYEQNVLVEFATIHGTPNHTTAGLYSIARHIGPDAPYDNRWFVTVAAGHELRTVTHWMPLPAAPTPTNGVSHD